MKLGGFQINAFPVPHDNVECRGFLIRHEELGKLLYMTDLEYSPYKFTSHKVNHMLIEANYDKRYLSDEKAKREHVLKGHLEVENSLEIIRVNNSDSLRNVILCHLSQQSASPLEFVERAKEIVKNDVYVDYARKGLEIDLSQKER